MWLILVVTKTLYSQTEKLSECLKVTRISESTFIHTCNHNNGLIYMYDKEAIIVSTPDSDSETQNLINWVKSKAKIIGYVIDRWHPDAMEGLDIVHENGIKSYANNRTKIIAKEKELPIPKVGFDDKLELNVGSKKIVCHYLGEAHTTDGIVVWIPEEYILFAGNEIRNNSGWIGNIADANLSEWSNTAKKIKNLYGNAKVVIPGHGNYGGVELIDYTIGLYSFSKTIPSNCKDASDFLIKESVDDFQFISESKEPKAEKVIYRNGKVLFIKKGKEIEICSDTIESIPSKKSFYIPNGWISIRGEGYQESFHFNQLYVKIRKD